MKKLITMLLLLITPVVTFAQFGLYVQQEGFSNFAWRNLVFPGGSTFYLQGSYAGFGLSVFQYSDWEGKSFGELTNDEFDILLSYDRSFDDYDAGLLLTQYNLPSVGEWSYSWEVGGYMTASNIPLAPTVEYYYDFDKFKAHYVGLNLSKSFKYNFSISATTGINTGQWIGESTSGASVVLNKGFNYLGFHQELSLGDLYTGENTVYAVLKLSN